MIEREPDIVTVNGRQIDFIEIHADGPLVPLMLRRSQGNGGLLLGGSGQKIRLSIDPDSRDGQLLESHAQQRWHRNDLEFECIHSGSLRKKIGRRGYIEKRVHDTWYLEFPDWEVVEA